MTTLRKLPMEVENMVKGWVGNGYVILHFWEADETYYVTCKYYTDIYFLRIFQVAGEWHLSQDKIFNI